MKKQHLYSVIKKEIALKCYVWQKWIYISPKEIIRYRKNEISVAKNSSEMKNITREQLSWLLSGLKINPEKCFKEIELNEEKMVV